MGRLPLNIWTSQTKATKGRCRHATSLDSQPIHKGILWAANHELNLPICSPFPSLHRFHIWSNTDEIPPENVGAIMEISINKRKKSL